MSKVLQAIDGALTALAALLIELENNHTTCVHRQLEELYKHMRVISDEYQRIGSVEATNAVSSLCIGLERTFRGGHPDRLKFHAVHLVRHNLASMREAFEDKGKLEELFQVNVGWTGGKQPEELN